MKRLFRKVCRDNRYGHHNDTGNNAALHQTPMPAVLKESLEHQVDQRQCTANHIGNCSGCSSPQVGAELLRSHRHKNSPEAGGEAHHPTDKVHGMIVGVEWAEE